MSQAQCRFCAAFLKYTFVDLGMSPLSNAFLTEEQLNSAEPFYPLHADVCENCLLVQLEQFESPAQIFSDYVYFSSYSDTWLKYMQAYTDLMVKRFGFNNNSQVIEIASNDGYLLQYFQQRGIPILGIEPAANVAKVAEKKGIPTRITFFGVKTAHELVMEGKRADLLIGNNVLAHVPALNDFVAGIKILLKPNGIFTLEFPHLLQLIKHNQFDTIYHEHFSYFSFLSVEKILAAHGLKLFDVEELPTHGGSLRIYGQHDDVNQKREMSERIMALKDKEIEAGLNQIETYWGFAEQAKMIKRQLLNFLIEAKNQGKRIVGYGAPAKGNTLLNYCGIRTDFLDYTVDRSPHKQGLYLPGTHIPIYPPAQILQTQPNYVLILPWNLKNEVLEQMNDIRQWGGKFVVPIPQVEVI